MKDLDEIMAIESMKTSDEIFIKFGFSQETLNRSAAALDITIKNTDELQAWVTEA
jgi:hypothetical protein